MIVGARKSQFQDNLAWLDVITPVHLQLLNEVTQIELGFPHFCGSDMIRDRLFGSIPPIDNHRS